MDTIEKRLSILTRHINHVAEDCEKLGKKMIENGDTAVGLSLIANGKIHDNSKFYGIEWEYLNNDVRPIPAGQDLFQKAVHEHVTKNKHHPEAWPNGIHGMDKLHLAEMVCDWHARSSEQGNCLVDWIHTVAMKKFGFKKDDLPYTKIMLLIEDLLEMKFV